MDETAASTTEILSGTNATGWPLLAIDRSKRGSLVDQIVAAIALMVNRRELRVGTKMPSVRQFAKCNGVSTFTVVESYDRLLTLGLLLSRRGSGFFVARSKPVAAPQQLALHPTPTAIDALTPDLYSGVSDALPVGAGWLPPEWIKFLNFQKEGFMRERWIVNGEMCDTIFYGPLRSDWNARQAR
jgi:DNA-binding transcriptional regulator YhcF (GntR family)